MNATLSQHASEVNFRGIPQWKSHLLEKHTHHLMGKLMSDLSERFPQRTIRYQVYYGETGEGVTCTLRLSFSQFMAFTFKGEGSRAHQAFNEALEKCHEMLCKEEEATSDTKVAI